jgi:hypothetical protein
MHHAEMGPVLACSLSGGVKSIAGTVDSVLGDGGLSSLNNSVSPEVQELMGLALNEVLYTVNEFAGEQTDGDGSSIELWVETTLLVVCVKFRGGPLPKWLLSNWDRGQEPQRLAPPSDVGWGWLLVREALDNVSHEWSGSQQLLYLERRL